MVDGLRWWYKGSGQQWLVEELWKVGLGILRWSLKVDDVGGVAAGLRTITRTQFSLFLFIL